MYSTEITPDRQTFHQLAKQGNVIPITREVLADMETPVSVFRRFVDRPNAFLLESVAGGERLAIGLAAPTGKAAARMAEAIRNAKASLPVSEAIKAALAELEGDPLRVAARFGVRVPAVLRRLALRLPWAAVMRKSKTPRKSGWSTILVSPAIL